LDEMTTSPAPSGAAAPAVAPSVQSRRRRRVVIGAVAAAIVIVAAIAIAIPVALSKSNINGPPWCGTKVTSHMSSQAAAYVRLATAANRAQNVISRRVAADPGGPIENRNIQAEIDLEVAFGQGLQVIPFTGQAAVDARAVAAANQNLIGALRRVETDRTTANIVQVHELRQQYPTQSLRIDLGMPPHSTCLFYQAI
jgi:hypothetical protein